MSHRVNIVEKSGTWSMSNRQGQSWIDGWIRSNSWNSDWYWSVVWEWFKSTDW